MVKVLTLVKLRLEITNCKLHRLSQKYVEALHIFNDYKLSKKCTHRFCTKSVIFFTVTIKFVYPEGAVRRKDAGSLQGDHRLGCAWNLRRCLLREHNENADPTFIGSNNTN